MWTRGLGEAQAARCIPPHYPTVSKRERLRGDQGESGCVYARARVCVAGTCFGALPAASASLLHPPLGRIGSEGKAPSIPFVCRTADWHFPAGGGGRGDPGAAACRGVRTDLAQTGSGSDCPGGVAAATVVDGLVCSPATLRSAVGSFVHFYFKNMQLRRLGRGRAH